MQERRIDVEDGKYTFVLKPDDYQVHVLRYGEPWYIIEQGCNAVWALVALAVDMKALTAAVERWAHVGDGALQHQELLAAFRAYLNELGKSQRGLVVIEPPPQSLTAAATAAGFTAKELGGDRYRIEMIRGPFLLAEFEASLDGCLGFLAGWTESMD